MVAISRHVADQLIAFGMASDRVVVVPNGIAVVRPPVPAPASEDLLVIARHDANKNLVGLLKALATAQQRLPQWRGVAHRGPRRCGFARYGVYVVGCPGLKDLN